MEESPKPGWIERIGAWLSHDDELETRDDLRAILRSAQEHGLMDRDALDMIYGVLDVSEEQVRRIMVPRAQMDVIDINDPIDAIIPVVIETAHSRFPVVDRNKDDVIGILLAKDLLQYYAKSGFHLREMLRPAVFIPESKRLNVLLREFRASRNHMAIVVDEYGGVAGLVTIEDVLEQIVGEIEDEYDFEDEEAYIIQDKGGRFRVKAVTELEAFNEAFGSHFADEEFGTIGGLVLSRFGHMPKRGETTQIDGFQFEVLRADSRRVHTLLVEKNGALPVADS